MLVEHCCSALHEVVSASRTGSFPQPVLLLAERRGLVGRGGELLVGRATRRLDRNMSLQQHREPTELPKCRESARLPKEESFGTMLHSHWETI